MIKTICRYGIELLGTACKSNIQIIQRLQSQILRTIVSANLLEYRNTKNTPHGADTEQETKTYNTD